MYICSCHKAFFFPWLYFPLWFPTRVNLLDIPMLAFDINIIIMFSEKVYIHLSALAFLPSSAHWLEAHYTIYIYMYREYYYNFHTLIRNFFLWRNTKYFLSSFFSFLLRIILWMEARTNSKSRKIKVPIRRRHRKK